MRATMEPWHMPLAHVATPRNVPSAAAAGFLVTVRIARERAVSASRSIACMPPHERVAHHRHDRIASCYRMTARCVMALLAGLAAHAPARVRRAGLRG